MADLNLLTEFFNSVPTEPAAPAGPDVDLLSEFFSQGAPSKRVALGQELLRERAVGEGVSTNLDVLNAAEKALIVAEPTRKRLETPWTSLLNAPVELSRDLGMHDDEPPFHGPLVVVPQEDIDTVGRVASQALSVPGYPEIRVPEQVTKGVVGGLADVASGLTTPELAIYGGVARYVTDQAKRAVSAYFAGTMANAVPEEAAHLGELSVTGTPEEQWRGGTSLAGTGYFVSHLAGSPAVKGRKQAEAAIIPAESRMMETYFREKEAAPYVQAQRDQAAQVLRNIRGSTPGRRAAARIAEEGPPVVELKTPEPADTVSVAATRALAEDIAAFKALNEQDAALKAAGKTFTPDMQMTPEYTALWSAREVIKNRWGGRDPQVVTPSEAAVEFAKLEAQKVGPTVETPEAQAVRLEAEAAALEATAPARRAGRKKAAAAAAEPWRAELDAAKAKATALNEEWAQLVRDNRVFVEGTVDTSPETMANMRAREANKNEWGGADPLTITPERAAAEWKKRTEAKQPKPPKPVPKPAAKKPGTEMPSDIRRVGPLPENEVNEARNRLHNEFKAKHGQAELYRINAGDPTVASEMRAKEQDANRRAAEFLARFDTDQLLQLMAPENKMEIDHGKEPAMFARGHLDMAAVEWLRRKGKIQAPPPTEPGTPAKQLPPVPADPLLEDPAELARQLEEEQSGGKKRAPKKPTVPQPPTTEAPGAIPIPGPAQVSPPQAPEAGKAVGKKVRSRTKVIAAEKAAAAEGGEKPVEPAATVKMRDPVTLRNDVFAEELPGFHVEHMDRGDVAVARIGYSATGSNKGFITIRGPGAPESSYRIPVTSLPPGSWEKGKGVSTLDRQAVMDFLSDPIRRFEAKVKTVKGFMWLHPDDVIELKKVKQPEGRPTVARKPTVGDVDAPMRETVIDPSTLEGTAEDLEKSPDLDAPARSRPAGRNLEEMPGITRNAFDALLKNPKTKDLADAIYKSRPYELEDEFWAKVEAEIFAQSDYKEEPGRPTKAQVAKGLTLSIRRLKDSDHPDLKWYAALESGRVSEGAARPRTPDQEVADISEALALVMQLDNGLTAEQRSVLIDILKSPVARYLDGRRIAFRITDVAAGDPRLSGAYRPVIVDPAFIAAMISVVRGKRGKYGAHEFFHPLWEILKEEDRIRLEHWRKQAVEMMIKQFTGKVNMDLRSLRDGTVDYKQFLDLNIDRALYPLSTAEEFFAWMMTERFQKDRLGIWGRAHDIIAEQDTFINTVKRIVEVVLDSIRQHVPGLRTQSDILKRQILDGKYEVEPLMPTEAEMAKMMKEHPVTPELMARLHKIREGAFRDTEESFKNKPGTFVAKNMTISRSPIEPPKDPNDTKGAITAYHGTPHLVRMGDEVKFDPSKVGSGQGAATYGKGKVYVAEHPAVAESIRKQLSDGHEEIAIDGVRRPDLVNPNEPWENPEAFAAWTVVVSNGRYGEGVEETIKNLTSLSHEPFRSPRERQGLRDAAEAARKWIGKKVTSEVAERGGNLYTVSINADPGVFLDWDKPLNKQSQFVQQALAPLIKEMYGTPVSKGSHVHKDRKSAEMQAHDQNADDALHWIVEQRPNGSWGINGYRKMGDGAEFYWELAAKLGIRKVHGSGRWASRAADDQAASDHLLSLGIKGNRYLDQGSRGQPDVRINGKPHFAEESSFGLNSYEGQAAIIARAWLDGGENVKGAIGWIQKNMPSGELVNGFKTVKRANFERALESLRVDTLDISKPPNRTSNYAIFDSSVVRITHENGKEVPLSQVMPPERGTQGIMETPFGGRRYDPYNPENWTIHNETGEYIDVEGNKVEDSEYQWSVRSRQYVESGSSLQGFKTMPEARAFVKLEQDKYDRSMSQGPAAQHEDNPHLWRVSKDSNPAFRDYTYRVISTFKGHFVNGFKSLKEANEHIRVEREEYDKRTGFHGDVGQANRGVQGAIDDADKEKQLEELKDKGSQVLKSEPGEVLIELDMNKKQLKSLLGASMYDNSITEVATKELLQNAFDTVRSAGATYGNPGIIDITSNRNTRELMVKDNGVGMTPEIIRTAFFTIGGSHKTGSLENNSGGLGLAKMAFILGSERIRLETNHNGMKSVVDATSEQIDTGKFAIKTERTSDQNGTTVTVKIPSTYTDAYGNVKDIWFDSSPDFLKEPLIGPARVTFNGAVLPIGVEQKGLQKENEFNFGWGRIDLYIQPDTKVDYPQVRVMSAGLKQFDAHPYVGQDSVIHYNMVLDVRPKVKTDNPAYPFNNQRENWRPTIQQDVDAMYTFLKNMAVEQELLQAKETFTDIRQLEKLDPMKQWTPEELAEMERRYYRKKFEPKTPTGEQRQVASVDFRGPDVIITYKDGGTKTENKEEYVKKSFEAKRKIDLKQTEIDVGELDPSVPYVHNNLTVQMDDVPGSGVLVTETGNVLLQFMREWGEKVGGDYEKLTDTTITGWFGGVSFDKSYRGLNMVKPMKAIWFNLGNFSKEGLTSPAAAASEALHIFIHEITHVAARSEGAYFTAELANNYAKIRSKDISVEVFEGTLEKIFNTNWEALNELNDRLQNYNTKNGAESFKSAAALGPESGRAEQLGQGASSIDAPGDGRVQEQGRAGAAGARPTDPASGTLGDILSGLSIKDGKKRGVQGALESPEKVEEFTGPMTDKPEFFKDMARVVNKGLVPPPVIEMFEALSAGAKGELDKLFPGRIGTYRDEAGAVIPGPTFREVMRDPDMTPEQKNDYAKIGLGEHALYHHERQKVFDYLADTRKSLDEAVIKSITDTPRTNEAEVLSGNLFASIKDKITRERGEAVEGAQTNERVREGIDNLARLTELLRQPVALSRALTGIANQVGNDALIAARPGEEVLHLISEATNYHPTTAIDATPREWVQNLATHLDQLTRSNGTKSILASRDVIEAALYGLRQVADARQALMEVQMTNDGTLRKFNEDYLADLQAKVPKGFSTILKNYAKAQVESDALTAAFKRLNKRIDTLTERQANLEEATSFLVEHDVNPEFIDFGKAVVQHTGAKEIRHTKEGPLTTYENPMTGEPVLIEHTYEKGDTVETIRKLMNLAEAGMQYAVRAGSDPQKAAWWINFAEGMDDYLKVASPDFDLLQDPLINPLALITKAQFGILAESTFSRIPGFLKHQANRTLQGWATAVKTKNAFQKDNEAKVLGNNTTAMRTHPGMSLGQWHKEINTLIIDSKQHFGQTPYKVGDRIIGFGHVITREDMKAVDAQYRYEQVLRKLHERTPVRVLTDNPAMIKMDNAHVRLAMSQGPGTVTRYLPPESRNLPKKWTKATKATKAPLVEGEASEVDRFLRSGDNFVRVMLGHVMEEERDYFLLGKGPFWKDYRALRSQKQSIQAAGEMPNNLDSLSEWLADHHNDHLPEMTPPVTPGEVRKQLIEEVTQYMDEITKNTKENTEAAKAAVMTVVVYENGFTRPRGGKIAPGTLYDYGLPDRQAMVSKGNDSVEFYLMEYREALTALHRSLVDNKTELQKQMMETYKSMGIASRYKMSWEMRLGGNPQLERHQLTYGETTRNINRTSRLLNNINRILESRREFYGDDIATRTFAPWAGSLVGSVLSRPLTWIRNASSGSVLWGMMTGEIRKGGWLAVPHQVLYNHLASFTKTILKNFIPKDAKQAAIKRMLDTPEIHNGIAREASNLLQEEGKREQLRRAGVLDTFSISEYLGLDAERSLLQNIKAGWDGLRNVNVRPGASLASETASYLGVAPRFYQILTRKIGMRWADNSINVKSVQFANSLAEALRFRAIESFDARLENDPIFRQLYEEYGDNFIRFSLALSGKGKAGLLTPAELTGKFIPLTTRKAAIQLRRMFDGNNDSVDKIMLKYWWNQRHASGDKQAPFMTDGQGLSLMFAMAQNVNMGTLANRAQFFAGSKFRQLAGVLGQYWLWNTDKLVDLMSKPKGERTLGVRYLPGTLGFLLVAALAGIVSTKVGQDANNLAFNTVSQKPDFFDATDDETRLKILLSNMGGYMGAVGSILAKLTDQPGKLGYTNPIFFANVLTDTMGMLVKVWQSKDVANPTMDWLAKYIPIAQAVINRIPGREGLIEVRNAANALRAATPASLEAKRRQPSPGSDFSLTPMTPLYNGIVNAAARGAWSEADELMAKAVEQQRAQGNPNPEAAILSAMRTRAPESSVFQRVLTDEEREMVYGRMQPEARAQVEKVNGVFDELASRYGRGTEAAGSFGSLGRMGGVLGGTGGASRSQADTFGRLRSLAAETPGPLMVGGGRPLSLGTSSGVRRGFRTRSLLRGGRSRSLLRRPKRKKLRLPRLRA